MKCDHPCGRRIRIKDFVTKLCFHMFAVWQLCVDIMIKCDYYLRSLEMQIKSFLLIVVDDL